MPDADGTEQARACEKEGIRLSLKNLMSFDFISSKVNANNLQLHGWYVDISAGSLSCYSEETGQFEDVK